jgi:NADPH-dependent 2,4-dienoyl-CoA reductase/sulfur reductase-like enzyme
VGGGPAGLESTLEARRAGFAVTLIELREELGGQFRLAPLTTGKESMIKPLESLVRAVEHCGADILRGVEATIDVIVDLEPDHVVVATGSRPVMPPIAGLKDPLTAAEVLTGSRDVGHRVLILGGGLVGIELAEHLALAGHEVVVVELLDEVARDMEAITRKMTLRRLQELPVTIHTKMRLARMAGDEAFVSEGKKGPSKSIGRFDSVVVAIGHKVHEPLSQKLAAASLPFTVIGDAREPRQIFDATQDGRNAIEALLQSIDAASEETTDEVTT